VTKSLLVWLSPVMLVALAACDLPFGLGQPTTRALESGAADTFSSATTFAMRGSYTGPSGEPWTISLLVARPDREDITVNGPNAEVEAIVMWPQAYFRGQAFLAQHMGTDQQSQALVRAAGNAWWKGSPGLAPQLPDLTDGATFRATFLGSAITQRTDNVSVDGLGAVELSGSRADVFIRTAAPHYVLRVHMKKGVVIDGLREADLFYNNFNRDYQITAPGDVIDFSNLSTLPPIYSVISVDTSGCGSPCVVSAQVKNLGGLNGAKAPSSVTFTMTATASGTLIGTCRADVVPDVGYNATTKVSCTINLSTAAGNSALTVTATADNPGHA